MPGISLTVSGQPDADLTSRLATEVADLTCRVLNKEIERTSVLVRYHPAEQWFIAGRSLVEHGKAAFKLEVTITDETNTRTEKAAYQREAYGLLARIIGNLHPHSNVHIIDCRASAYGYAGVTQEEYRLRSSAGRP